MELRLCTQYDWSLHFWRAGVLACWRADGGVLAPRRFVLSTRAQPSDCRFVGGSGRALYDVNVIEMRRCDICVARAASRPDAPLLLAPLMLWLLKLWAAAARRSVIHI
jgi:hypothetical protein